MKFLKQEKNKSMRNKKARTSLDGIVKVNLPPDSKDFVHNAELIKTEGIQPEEQDTKTLVDATFFDRFGKFAGRVEFSTETPPHSFDIRSEIEKRAFDKPTADGFSYIYRATSLKFPDNFTFLLVR